MSQPQQLPKAVAPQSATANAAIATVCHLVAGGAITRIWSLLQMETTTRSQNRQLVVLCIIALITFAGGVTLLHVLIANYKCWVMHAYSVAALQQAQAATDSSPGKQPEPSPAKSAPTCEKPQPTAQEPKPTPPKPKRPQSAPAKSQPPPPAKAAPTTTTPPKPKRRIRWRF